MFSHDKSETTLSPSHPLLPAPNKMPHQRANSALCGLSLAFTLGCFIWGVTRKLLLGFALLLLVGLAP